jgi:hypothetical protein
MNMIFTIEKKSVQMQKDFIKKIRLLICLIFVFSSAAYSQKYQVVQQGLVPENLNEMNRKQSQGAFVNNLFAEIDGTYQIQYLVPDYKILFSEALYNKIKENRKADVDSYIELDKNSRLFLPSANEIKKRDFNKLSNSIYITK